MTTTEAPKFTAAKRGDAVVVAETHRDWVIGQAMTERTTYELGVVTSITRDGHVKAWRLSWSDQSYAIPQRRAGLWLLPAAAFDVAGCVAAANAHKWHGHPDGLPKPFDSLEEIRETLRPFRR